MRLAIKEYCFVADAAFNGLKALYDLQTGFTSVEKTSSVSASLSYSTRSVRGQVSSEHDVFSSKEVAKAVKLMSNEVASGRHGHVFCSELLLICFNNSLVKVKEAAEDVVGDLKC